MIGKTFGHYRIDAQLGAGGMGVVFRAHDTRLGRDVALKFVSESSSAKKQPQDQLLAEARAASALNHPNVAHIYDVGEIEGRSYIAMEHVPGKPLRGQIPAEGSPLETVARYGAQIADALAHAHQHGVVHRDLKSANVMITPEGRAKVLDFGLARRLGEEELSEATKSLETQGTSAGIAGTLHYMPPEVLRGESGDARSDIWALGVVLFEMATGALPFRGRTGFELTSAILREPPAAFPARVPPGLRAVIHRCLTKEPGERYQSGSEVRAALEALQFDTGVTSPIPASTRRRIPLWAIGGGVLLILAALLGYFLKGNLGFQAGPAKEKKTPAESGGRLSTGGKPSSSAEANEYFEKGVLFLGVQLDIPRARQMFEKALEADPRFAEARSWHAYTYLVMFDSGYSNDTSEFYKAEEDVRRALQDDPSAGHPHTVLAGFYLYQGRKDLVPGEAEKALAANPDDLDARTWLLGYHWLNGDYAAAEVLVKQSIERAPLNLLARVWYGAILREEGDAAGAIRELNKVLEQDPQFLYAIVFLAQTYMDQPDLRKARQTLERARPADRQNFWMRTAWALLLALEGKNTEAAKEMDREVLKYGAAMPFAAAWTAEVYAALGEKDKALEWLERGVRNGDERVEWFQRNPMLASIRTEPRFKQIIESIAFRRQK